MKGWEITPGRIFRVATDFKQVRASISRIKSLALHQASDEALIASLNASNAWERNTAQRLLLERDSKQHSAQNKLLLKFLQPAGQPAREDVGPRNTFHSRQTG
jgi:hypothetical protein